MPKHSEKPTRAGQGAAAAPWSLRARAGTFVLIVALVATATAFILQKSGGPARAAHASKASHSASGSPTTPGQAGIAGSGIGRADGTASPHPSKASPTASLTTAPITQSTQGPSLVSHTPSTAPKSATPSPVHTSTPTAPPSSPTPSPTRKKHCIPNTRICI